MKYKVSVIKKIAFLVMTMALAVAMVACSGAVGKQGPPGPPGETPTTTPPTTTPPTTTPPTTTPSELTAKGTIADVTLPIADSPKVMDMAGYFTGGTGTLIFTASSLDTAVASVSISGSSLTITALKVGIATVTVNVTDAADDSASQTFNVTVTSGTTTLTKSVTLDGKGKNTEVSGIPAAQHLESNNKRIVTVARKSGSTTDWILTAEAKGKAGVNIILGREVVGTVAVTVNNTAPAKTDKSPNPTYVMRPPPNESDLKDTTVDNNLRGFFETNIEPGLFFTDIDGDSLTFHARSSSNDVLVKKVTADHVILDMLKADIGGSIILTVHAEDSDGDLSGTVEFDVEVNVADGPWPDVYDVTQYLNGEFKPIEVWDREDSDHELTFKNVLVQDTDGTTRTVAGYKFAEDFLKANSNLTDLDWNQTAGGEDPEVGDHRVNYGPTNPAAVPTNKPEGTEATVENVRHYYSVSTTGPVAVAKSDFHNWIDGDAADETPTSGQVTDAPQLRLKVTGPGPSTGTVTITYHLLVDPDGDETGLGDTTAENADNKWITRSETVTVNVMASRSSN